MMNIRRAAHADLHTVLEILRSAADWLHARGYDQWPDGSPSLSPARISAQIGRGEFWLASSGREPVATFAVSPDGDPDFWTAAELAEHAVYLSKAAVVPRCVGQRIGELGQRWVGDRAARQGARWLRLDAWRTNHDLHRYYLQRGWTQLRTADVPGRRSGALFQRPAVLDVEARAAFTEQPPIAAPVAAGMMLPPGT
jgi:hypothetical protein